MTSEQCGYKEGTSYDYFEAGVRCHNMNKDQADEAFDTLAKQHGVKSGAYGSWDMFWYGYFDT